MNLSEGVLIEAKRLETQGAFRLNQVQKQELSNFNKENDLLPLDNFWCATCVRNSLYAVIRFINSLKKQPKLQSMSMIKPVETLSFIELKAMAKAKGVGYDRYTKKDELINLLQ